MKMQCSLKNDNVTCHSFGGVYESLFRLKVSPDEADDLTEIPSCKKLKIV